MDEPKPDSYKKRLTKGMTEAWWPEDPLEQLFKKKTEAAEQPDNPQAPDSFAEHLHSDEFVTDWEMERGE